MSQAELMDEKNDTVAEVLEFMSVGELQEQGINASV